MPPDINSLVFLGAAIVAVAAILFFCFSAAPQAAVTITRKKEEGSKMTKFQKGDLVEVMSESSGLPVEEKFMVLDVQDLVSGRQMLFVCGEWLTSEFFRAG